MRLLARLLLLQTIAYFLFFYFFSTPWSLIGLILLYGALNSLFLCLWIHFHMSPTIFGKHQGKLMLWSYFVFWPLHLMIYIFSNLVDRYLKGARKHKETDFTQITSRFYIGGRYSNKYMDQDTKNKIVGVVDLTNEFPELQFPNKKYYWNIQTWDGTAPDMCEMLKVIQDIKKWYNSTPDSKDSLLIHCGYGRGRSTTFLALLLFKLDIYASIEEAFQEIKKSRPSVKLNPEMRRVLKMKMY